MYKESNKSVIKVYTEELYGEERRSYTTAEVIAGKRYAPDDVEDSSQEVFDSVYKIIKKAVNGIDYSRKASKVKDKGTERTPKPFTINVEIGDISNGQFREMEDRLEKEIPDKCGPFGISLDPERANNKVNINFWNNRS